MSEIQQNIHQQSDGRRGLRMHKLVLTLRNVEDSGDVEPFFAPKARTRANS